MKDLPALELVLADPDRALALLGEGPARAATIRAVRGFFSGVREYEAGREPGSLFAWEGAGLAAARRGPEALAKLVGAHPHAAPLCFVGAGWLAAFAGQPLAPPDPRWLELSPGDAWSLVDGWGFCVALLRRRVPDSNAASTDPRVHTCAQLGLGRGLYFSHGGAARGIARAIEGAPARDRSARWLGVGVASVITDGLDEAARARLRRYGGPALAAGELLAHSLLARLAGTKLDRRVCSSTLELPAGLELAFGDPPPLAHALLERLSA